MNFLVSTYTGSLIMVAMGSAIILWAIRRPQKKEESYPYDMKRWAAGIAFLLLGITVFVGKLTGQL
ncbi:MAG TPA: hypothetical protein VF868_09240 [Bacteroidia bacterium]|jgi:heme A synthase